MANSVAAQSKPIARRNNSQRRRKMSEWLTAYMFVLPGLTLFLFFVLFSLLYNIYIGFHEWTGFGAPRFAGLENYVRLAQDSLFWNALWNNLIFILVSLFVMTALSLLIALVLDSGIPGANLFRALLFVPVIIPGIVIYLVWSRIYSAQSGLLNRILEIIGLESWQRDWLGNPDTALWAVLIVFLWQSLGYGIVMFHAGLVGIPEDLKGAAAIDGATPRQVAQYVIIPLLLPITVIVGVWFALSAFKVFGLVYILTNGGPYNSTEVLGTYMYKQVFSYFDLGVGSAVANIGILILVALAVLRSRFKSAVEY